MRYLLVASTISERAIKAVEAYAAATYPQCKSKLEHSDGVYHLYFTGPVYEDDLNEIEVTCASFLAGYLQGHNDKGTT